MEVICQRSVHPRCVDFSSPATILTGFRCREPLRTGTISHLRVVLSIVEVTERWLLKWTTTNCVFGIMNPNGWLKRRPRVAEPSSTNLVGDCSGYRVKVEDSRSTLLRRLMIMFNVHCSLQSEAQCNCSKVPEVSPFQLMTCVGSISRKYDETWECAYRKGYWIPQAAILHAPRNRESVRSCQVDGLGNPVREEGPCREALGCFGRLDEAVIRRSFF
jgi:hypothetical protein